MSKVKLPDGENFSVQEGNVKDLVKMLRARYGVPSQKIWNFFGEGLHSNGTWKFMPEWFEGVTTVEKLYEIFEDWAFPVMYV